MPYISAEQHQRVIEEKDKLLEKLEAELLTLKEENNRVVCNNQRLIQDWRAAEKELIELKKDATQILDEASASHRKLIDLLWVNSKKDIQITELKRENEHLQVMEKDLPYRWDMAKRLTETEAMLKLYISMHANHKPCEDRCPIDSLHIDSVIGHLRNIVEGELAYPDDSDWDQTVTLWPNIETEREIKG